MVGTAVNRARVQEFYRDFVRFRQNAFLGWPDPTVYSEKDLRYFDTLEAERLTGRLKIEGEVKTLADYE